MNVKEIWESLGSSGSTIDILLGFVALLSGAPIGFLVTQFWYAAFNLCIKRRYFSGDGKPWTLLWRLTGSNSKLDSNKESKLDVIQNYIQSVSPPSVQAYLDRRWDVVNLAGSGGLSIVLGLVFGWGVRYILPSMYNAIPYIVYTQLDGFMILVSILMVLLFILAVWRARDEHISMISFLIWLKTRKDVLENGNLKLDKVLEAYLGE